MPRYEDDDRDRRRRSDASRSPVRRDRGSSRRDDKHHRSSHRDGKEPSRRQSESPILSPEGHLRSRRKEEDHRNMSRSRDSRRRRKNRSEDGEHTRDNYHDTKRPSRRHRSKSPSSASPPPRSASPRPPVRSEKPLPPQQDAFSKTPHENPETSTPTQEKAKANYANTGLLAAETNTVRAEDGSASIVLKYHEPPEARKPPAKEPWRLYIFKGKDLLDTLELGGRSCWLIGKERLVADLSVDHPGCSKQHAALQFRYVEKRNEFGDRDGRVRPYLIDLESANGSTVNGDAVPTGRYMELRDKDVMKFGLSTREYVLMLPPSV